jgi:formylglycine-generating enzyme
MTLLSAHTNVSDRLKRLHLITLALCLSVMGLGVGGEALGKPASERIAVIDFEGDGSLESKELVYLANKVRGVSSKLSRPGFFVYTRENTLDRLGPEGVGKASEGVNAIDTGRLMEAHYVVTGRVNQIGGYLRLTLTVHRVKSSQLLGSTEAKGKDIDHLSSNLEMATHRINRLIDPTLPGPTEREIHEAKVLADWRGVQGYITKSGVELFLSRYEGHPLGNPKREEASEALRKLLAREHEAEKKRLAREHEAEKKRLAREHRARVEENWTQVSEEVLKGDDRGERALQTFLKKYSNHPLGNPLETKARRAFTEAKKQREARLSAAHLAKIEEAWRKLKPLFKVGGAPAIKAVKMFITQYKKHERGNPLQTIAEETLVLLIAEARLAEIKWVRIQGGSFEMGSKNGDSDEKPVHRVTIKSFLMSKTEVTVGQYRQCVKTGTCSPANQCAWGEPNWTSSPSTKEDHPINCVDWNQARTFAKWAEADLPSEAEWEYVARGGQGFKYAGSNDPDEVAWYDSNSEGRTHKVGTKRKNGFGVYDMSGNLREWVLDEYKGNYDSAPSDGSPACSTPTCSQSASRRVERGGSWSSIAGTIRVAARFTSAPDYRLNDLGFRLRRTLP